MSERNWIKEMEDEFSYGRLCKAYNAVLERLLEIDNHILDGCEFPVFDPEVFQWRWIRNPWSVEDGIMLEVRSVNPHLDDPSKYPLSQKLSVRDDELHVRLVTGQVGYAMKEIVTFERKYRLPEDFHHIMDDVVELVHSRSSELF